MHVLLNDIDSHGDFGNLALMKISAYHKARGDRVTLYKGFLTMYPIEDFDLCYASCVYRQNEEIVNNWAKEMPFPVLLGGSGVNENVLTDEIEHIMPDYSLYGLNHSMGFTSRGCIRKCGFCIVPQKEGMIRDNAPISEFLHADHNRVKLLDNNFQASPKWKENSKFIINNKLKVNFTQGFDARLMNEEFAGALAEMKPQSTSFKGTRITMACDSIKVMPAVERAINRLTDAGISKYNISVYVLIGYDTTLEEDLKRIHFLADKGVTPFAMRYNMVKGLNDILMHLARYTNRYVWRKATFKQYLKTRTFKEGHNP